MTSDPGALAHFLYRNIATDDCGPHDIRDILNVARDRNTRLGLTGCLHVEDGFFFQWLEGPAEALTQVIASLRADWRHRDIVTLSEGGLAGRLFGGWNMNLTGLKDASIVDWLAAQGVSRREGRDYSAAILRFLQEIS